MKNSIQNTTALLVFLASLTVYFSSCRPDKPPKAEITVVDSTGAKIKSATVVYECTPLESTDCEILDSVYTDTNGEAVIELEKPAVLKTTAYIVLAAQGSSTTQKRWSGEKFVKFEMDEVTKETITIKSE